MPSIAFAHVDYPKLVPVLAAQISMLAQFWNEQLPKFSLLILLVPPLALTFSYWRAWLSFAAISVLVWLRLDPDLCSGYLDAPLAMFGLFAALQLGAWLTRGSQLNLVGGIVFIAIACGLKNEGSLLGLSAVVCTAAVFVFIRSRGRELLPNRRPEQVRLGLVCLLVALSCVAWPIVRAHWGMHNDLQLGLQSIPRMIQRLHEPKMLAMIAQSTLLDSGLAKAALIGVAMIAISVCFRQKRLIEPILCVAVATIYLTGIEFVYLSTPIDLKFHLKTSADRTTLLPIVLFLAPVFLLFRDLTLPRTELARGPVASG